MGLDNGFVLKGVAKKDLPWFVHSFCHEDLKPEDDSIELAYYRKCWGIRSEILGNFNFQQAGGKFGMDGEDLIAAAKLLMKFLDKEYFEENSDSAIFSYEEMVESMKQYIVNLIWAGMTMCDKNVNTKDDNGNDKITAYFYDSY